VALSRNLSRKAAFEMLVTGAFISADEAQAKGLVNRVVEADQLDEEIDSLVNSIVAKPRVALALGKSLFYRQLEVGIEEAYTDAGQGTMPATGSGSDALSSAEAGEGLLSGVGSGSDALAVSEAGEGLSTATGSGADSWVNPNCS
jgi:enoyl-CoA hydratase/carnithine racemase